MKAKKESQPCLIMLKALADETRWRVVRELLAGSLTVNEITHRLGAEQCNVSKHIRILREAGIVGTERDGRFVRCAIAPAFRKRLAKNQKTLDLGCCSFRFSPPAK